MRSSRNERPLIIRSVRAVERFTWAETMMRWALDYHSRRSFEHDFPDVPLSHVPGEVREQIATARFVARRLMLSDVFAKEPELSVHLAGATTPGVDLQIAIRGHREQSLQTTERRDRSREPCDERP